MENGSNKWETKRLNCCIAMVIYSDHLTLCLVTLLIQFYSAYCSLFTIIHQKERNSKTTGKWTNQMPTLSMTICHLHLIIISLVYSDVILYCISLALIHSQSPHSTLILERFTVQWCIFSGK